MQRAHMLMLMVGYVLVMVVSLGAAYALLPQQVAEHFNAAGQPDAWTTRERFVAVMALVCLGLPLLLIGVFWGVRFLPSQLINIPHREYWLSSERRGRTHDLLLASGLRFVVLQGTFFVAVLALVVVANRAAPVQLSPLVWLALAVCLGLVGVWLWSLWRAFRLPA